ARRRDSSRGSEIVVREHGGSGGGGNARELAGALGNTENFPTRLSRVFLYQAKIHFGNEVSGGDESRIKPSRGHGSAEKQAGGKEQDEREGDLQHHRCVSGGKKSTEPANACRLADLLF